MVAHGALKGNGSAGESCGVALLRPLSNVAPCVLGATFGCSGKEGMFVERGCRGVFQCGSSMTRCGYRGQEKGARYECTCRQQKPCWRDRDPSTYVACNETAVRGQQRPAQPMRSRSDGHAEIGHVAEVVQGVHTLISGGFITQEDKSTGRCKVTFADGQTSGWLNTASLCSFAATTVDKGDAFKCRFDLFPLASSHAKIGAAVTNGLDLFQCWKRCASIDACRVFAHNQYGGCHLFTAGISGLRADANEHRTRVCFQTPDAGSVDTRVGEQPAKLRDQIVRNLRLKIAASRPTVKPALCIVSRTWADHEPSLPAFLSSILASAADSVRPVHLTFVITDKVKEQAEAATQAVQRTIGAVRPLFSNISARKNAAAAVRRMAAATARTESRRRASRGPGLPARDGPPAPSLPAESRGTRAPAAQKEPTRRVSTDATGRAHPRQAEHAIEGRSQTSVTLHVANERYNGSATLAQRKQCAQNCRRQFPAWMCEEDYGYAQTDVALENTLRLHDTERGGPFCGHVLVTNSDNIYSRWFLRRVDRYLDEQVDVVTIGFVGHYGPSGHLASYHRTMMHRQTDLGGVIYRAAFLRATTLRFCNVKQTVMRGAPAEWLPYFCADQAFANATASLPGTRIAATAAILYLHDR